MRPIDHHLPTIGFLSTWSVYEGTTIDNYTRTLLQGICACCQLCPLTHFGQARLP